MTTHAKPIETTQQQTTRPWNVVLYNDDHHDFDEVVVAIQKATGKSQEEAFRITWEAHTNGKSIAYTADLTSCQKVAGSLRTARLQVEVDES